MKRYPSIPRRLKGRRSRGAETCPSVHVFDKLDGANIRFEWSRERGWHRFGSRNVVLDASHPVFGPAMELFRERLAPRVERVAVDQRWPALVAFAEFWNQGSLGGQLDEHSPLQLTLFDVAPYKQGFVGPERFLELFASCDVPRYLGEHRWDDAFVARVRDGALPGVTLEGVVGKAGERHRVVRVKAKTQAWIDAILRRYGEQRGRQLVDS